MFDLHSIKQEVQNFFSDGLLPIIGSGLSAAEGIPGMGDLADYLVQYMPRDLPDEEAQRWLPVKENLMKGVNLEQALLLNQPNPKLEKIIRDMTANFLLPFEESVIKKYASEGIQFRFSRLLGHLNFPETGQCVITTNYDRLIEAAAELSGCGVDTMFVGNYIGTINERDSRHSFIRDIKKNGNSVVPKFQRKINLLKPHGSFDWFLCQGRPVRSHFVLSQNRLIITPGANKFRNGYEPPFDLHREQANRAIDKASAFLIVGYGFNDDHLETHLRPAIEAGRRALVVSHTLSPSALKVVANCKNVIAIVHGRLSGVDGTLVHVQGSDLFFPKIQLWDVNHFVREILEP